jgi:membrane protease YdiL (CAAX protease family)
MKKNDALRIQKSLALFLALTFGFSLIWYIVIITQRNDNYYLPLMYCPGVAALVTILVCKHSFQETGLRLKNSRYICLAFVIIVVASLLVYGFVWLTNPGALDTNQLNTILHSWIGSLLAFIFLLMLNTILAFGEEFGWRGFLVPQMSKIMSFWKVALLSGLIWATWHWPLIIWSDYKSSTIPPWASLLFFSVDVTLGSVAYAWLRLRSDCLWPAVILHGTYNTVIQDVLNPLVINTPVTE